MGIQLGGCFIECITLPLFVVLIGSGTPLRLARMNVGRLLPLADGDGHCVNRKSISAIGEVWTA